MSQPTPLPSTTVRTIDDIGRALAAPARPLVKIGPGDEYAHDGAGNPVGRIGQSGGQSDGQSAAQSAEANAAATEQAAPDNPAMPVQPILDNINAALNAPRSLRRTLLSEVREVASQLVNARRQLNDASAGFGDSIFQPDLAKYIALCIAIDPTSCPCCGEETETTYLDLHGEEQVRPEPNERTRTIRRECWQKSVCGWAEVKDRDTEEGGWRTHAEQRTTGGEA